MELANLHETNVSAGLGAHHSPPPLLPSLGAEARGLRLWAGHRGHLWTKSLLIVFLLPPHHLSPGVVAAVCWEEKM